MNYTFLFLFIHIIHPYRIEIFDTNGSLNSYKIRKTYRPSLKEILTNWEKAEL